MTWRNIRHDKPQDGQRVLVYSRALAAHDKSHGDVESPGVHVGHYIAAIDELRPFMTHGFKAQFWMPLPEGPVKCSKRKVAV